MTDEIKNQIDNTGTRQLVSDILEEKYSDVAKEYAIKCVKTRFVIIAEKLEKLETLEQENEKLKESTKLEDSILFEYQGTISKLEERIKSYDEITEKLTNSKNKANQEIIALEKENRELKTELETKVSVVKEEKEIPSSENSFFTELFSVLPDIVGLKSIIRKENELGIVSIFPEPFVSDESFKMNLPPMNFRGTPEELDANIISQLKENIKAISSVTNEIANYEKAIEEAKAKSEMQKSKKAEADKLKEKNKKKIEKLVEDLNKAKTEENSSEVEKILGNLYKLDPDKYKKEYEEVKFNNSNQKNLF